MDLNYLFLDDSDYYKYRKHKIEQLLSENSSKQIIYRSWDPRRKSPFKSPGRKPSRSIIRKSDKRVRDFIANINNST